MIARQFHPVAEIFPLLGDAELRVLADDIAANGLREPIWLHADGRIIDGRNRYRACGLAEAAPTYREWHGDDAELVPFVVSLNLHRRHLNESQRADVAGRIATLAWGGDRTKVPIGALTDAQAAKLLNVSERSVERAKVVQRDGVPELREAVQAGRVSVAAAADVARIPAAKQSEIVARGEKEILEAAKAIRIEKGAQRRDELAKIKAEAPPLPDGRFSVIVADPPWPMEKIERDVAPNQVAFEYPTMSEEELAAFGLPSIAADDCHLFLWTTHKFLPMAFRLLERWGFRYVCAFVWHKPGGFQPFGLPQYNCEFALYARKGSPTFRDTKAFPVCFDAGRREHSRKPDEFYDMIRRTTDGPRIDVFSREAREGFDQFGNEAGKFAA